MTASAGAWYRVGTVNVTNGQQSIVGVNTNWQNDVISIAVGDIFTLDAKTWYEVTAVNSDTSLTLDREFEGATQSAVNYAIVRNTSGTLLTRIAGQIAVQFNQKQLFLDELRTWLNSDNAAEELTDSHGVKTQLKTPAQMVRDHAEKLAELDAIHPHPWAMRKVEFEAMRAANEEKYAASGFVHFGKHYLSSNTSVSINEGLWTITTQPDALRLGRDGGSGESENDFAAIVIAGVITELKELSIVDTKIKLPPAEDGTRTYDSATGESVTHATPALAFAAETATNKVVTDRVDMWGFEAFLREINDNDPFVYKNGLIQSLATEINGVPTVSDNVRAVTYFAWYEGDTTSRGKGVNWQTATEAQRIAIASDPENNIYFDDATGKFYQRCVRGRSFAGAGNGDWQYVDSTGSNYLRFAEKYVVNPIGSSDTALANSSATSVSYRATNRGVNKIGVEGVFNAGDVYQESVAVNGECYFLVCGTIERLNQGAYHPSHNRFGSAKLTSDGSNYQFWYEYTGSEITDQLSVFENTRVNTGAIGQASGRPDGRYFDAIYASGQGGVCRDMRYSAHKLTAEDFAKEDLKIKSGEYRGREALSITKFYAGNVGGNTVSKGWQLRNYDGTGVSATGVNIALNTNNPVFAESLKYGRVFAITDGVNSLALKVAGVLVTNVYSLTVLDEIGSFPIVSSDSGQDSSSLSILIDVKHNVSVAGEYTHTEVIGDPAKIMLCEDLKYGWCGSWNPVIPNGMNPWNTFQTSSPTNSYVINKVQTDDDGVSFTSGTHGFSPNMSAPSATTSPPLGRVEIWYYKTKARPTISTTNSEVYRAKTGLGDVIFSQSCNEWGARQLGYSLTGGILTSIRSGTSKFFQTVKLESYSLYEGKLGAWTSTNRGSPTHALPKDFNAPENEGPAFKALNYNVAKNQQGFINYAYAQLTYDATAGDWGDDGKIHPVDNQTTMLDENGHTNLVGMACCVEPIGWV